MSDCSNEVPYFDECDCNARYNITNSEAVGIKINVKTCEVVDAEGKHFGHAEYHHGIWTVTRTNPPPTPPL